MNRCRSASDGDRKRVTCRMTDRMCSSRARASASATAPIVATATAAAGACGNLGRGLLRGPQKPLGLAGRQRLLDRPQNPFGDERRSAHPRRGPEASVAAIRLRSVTDPVVRVEQLAAMAEEPVVVKGEDHRYAARVQEPDDARRQAREVMHMSDVRLERVDQARGDGVDGRIRISLGKRHRLAKRVVEPEDLETVPALNSRCVLRLRGIRLTRQHAHLMAARGERARVRVGVCLGAARGFRRERVDDDQDAHQTVPGRHFGSGRPRTAERAPKYCPAGHATARAAVCSHLAGWPRSHRR